MVVVLGNCTVTGNGIIGPIFDVFDNFYNGITTKKDASISGLLAVTDSSKHMKRYFLCSRKALLSTISCAVLLFALPFIANIPYSQSALLHKFENNLWWIFFFVFVAFDIGKQNFGRSLVYAATISVVYIALSSFMFVSPTISDFALRRHFDSEAWKDAAWKTSVGPHSNVRLQMVDDLLKRYKLIGMTRVQLVELLGPPNPFESRQSDVSYTYYLGPERGFISIDDEWLDIKFGGERVVSARDRTD